jgi:ABC-type glutathione transport system ATPase component
MTELVIDHVTRTFPARQGHAPTRALEPVELTIGNNEFVTILGPSGCGKSTLLRIVAGLDHPTSGKVLLDGREVTGPGAERGMVFQSYTLFPWLTVRENIAFGLRERGVAEADRNAAADRYIQQIGLKGFEATVWWGIVAPAGTPGDIVAKLNAEINKTLGSDEMKRFLEGEGAEAGAMTPQGFRELTEREAKRWDKVAKDGNIRAD